MKKLLYPIASLALVISGLFLAYPSNAVTCLPVTTSRGILTTVVIAVNGQLISGDTDASGCDIGIYIGTGVTGVTISATVHDADKFGIYNDGGDVGISGSAVTKTGNHTAGVFDPNGVQTGLGVLFDPGSTGSIEGSIISEYQKGGIVVNGAGTSASLIGNTVTGLGPVNFIAQNGIQVSRGAIADLTENEVSGNIYTQNGDCAPGGVGSCVGVVSTGVLFFQAGVTPKTGEIASSNHVFRNQANVTIIE
jgi:hypothetical protein